MTAMTRELPDTIKVAPGYLLLEILDNEESEEIVTNIKDGDKPQRGKVLLVGSKTYYSTGQDMESPCGEGDIVVHSAFGYEDFRYKGKKYRLCPFNKVLASYSSKEYVVS